MGVKESQESNEVREPDIGLSLHRRRDWLHEAASELQRLSLRLLDPFSEDNVIAALARLPRPADRLERLTLYGLLLETLAAAEGGSAADRDRWIREFVQSHLRRRAVVRRDKLSFAARAAHVIQSRFSLPLNVPALASEAGCDQTRLRRDFQEEFGMTIREYQVRVRIREALYLAADGTHSYSQVAEAVGYRREANLTRASRRLLGTTIPALAAQPPDAVRLLARTLVPKCCRRVGNGTLTFIPR